MAKASCTVCDSALGPAPLYSAEGDLVCSDCYQRSASNDRLRANAPSVLAILFATFYPIVVETLVEPWVLIGVGAALGTLLLLQIFRPHLQERPAESKATRALRYAAIVGLALAGLWTAWLAYPMAKRFAAMDVRSDAPLATAPAVTEHTEPVTARASLTIHCERDRDGHACLTLGTYFDNGYYGDSERGQALDYYKRACKLHWTEGCVRSRRWQREARETQEALQAGEVPP